VKAKEVFFIIGSDAYGPMGEELLPVKGGKQAETFMKDHKGERMLVFDEITPADIPGMKMMHHKGR
jgi:nitrous oxide reductase accessory protein NosL